MYLTLDPLARYSLERIKVLYREAALHRLPLGHAQPTPHCALVCTWFTVDFKGRASAFYPRGELGGMSQLHTGTPRDAHQRHRVERQHVVEIIVPSAS